MISENEGVHTMISKTIEPIVFDGLIHALEPLIRRVVREELERIIEKKSDVFYLESDMPLYADMLDIKKRRKKGQIKLYSHEEVWSE